MEDDNISLLIETARNINVDDEENKGQPSPAFSADSLQQLSTKIEEELKNSNQAREDIETDETGWTSEDSLYAAQRFFSSAALGWGDELGLWVAAAINANLIDPVYGLKTSTKDEYKRLKERHDKTQEEFKERKPGAALTADIAGAVASPVTYVSSPIAVGSKVGQIGSLAGRVATEGAIYGAGESEEGRRIEGAKKGATDALIGAAAIKGLTSGASIATNFVTKRRIEGDLIDNDGDFVPLTLAASNEGGVEGLIHTFYRDIVGPSFGGKGIIKQQENVKIGKQEDLLESHKVFSGKLDDGIKKKKTEIDQQIKNAYSAVKAEADNLKNIKKEEAKGLLVPLQTKLQALKTNKAEEIVAKATSETRKLLDSRRLAFRNETFLNSFPKAATPQEVQRVLKIENIGDRAKALDNLWQSKGYSMIKNKKFRFKSGELENQLQKALQNDDYFAVNTVDIPSVMKIFGRAVENTNFFKDPAGRIEGSLVSSLRSRVGTLANQAVDPQQKRALYTLQDEIDKIMKKQLTGKQKKAFEEEAGKWKSTVVLRETIETAQFDPKKRGFFDESDWISEVGKNNRWDSRYGTGPLNKTARALEFNLSQAEKSIAKRASNLGKIKARIIENEIKDHRKKLGVGLKKIDNSLTSKKARLSKNPGLSVEIANDIKNKEKYTSEITELESTLKKLQALRSPQIPSWFHTFAATGVLAGLWFGGSPGTALAGAAVGYGLGRSLSTPQAQKVIAGQTPTQEQIQRFLQDDKTGQTAEILGRVGGGIGSRVGMFSQ